MEFLPAIDPDVKQQLLSGAFALEIVLIIGFVILKVFKFVHSRRSSGNEW